MPRVAQAQSRGIESSNGLGDLPQVPELACDRNEVVGTYELRVPGMQPHLVGVGAEQGGTGEVARWQQTAGYRQAAGLMQ